MAHALSPDPRGLKRICLSCSTRFYDMNKRPIVCPNCAAEFTGEIKIKTRRGRLPAEIANDEAEDQVIEKDDDDSEEDEDAETVSLDDVEKAEDDEGDDAEAVELDAEELEDDDDLEDLDDDDDDDDLDVDVDVDEDK